MYITLVRGIPGTRRLHRRTLEALRLRKCNRTVMRWNTPTVRGMLQQVFFFSSYFVVRFFAWFCVHVSHVCYVCCGINCCCVVLHFQGEKVGCSWDRRDVQGSQTERGESSSFASPIGCKSSPGYCKLFFLAATNIIHRLVLQCFRMVLDLINNSIASVTAFSKTCNIIYPALES